MKLHENWEFKTILRNNLAWIKLHFRLGTDEIKADEMNGACSTHGRDEKFIQKFSRKT
jgi:hypothetical protein